MITTTALLLVVAMVTVNANIEGPNEFVAGQLAVLDGSNSAGDKLQWVVPPQMKSLPSKTMKLGLTCDQPGKYVVLLIAVDRDLNIAVATHEIEVLKE